MFELLKYIPKSYLSFVMGWLSGIKLPNPFRLMLIRWFATRYKINVSEASKPLDAYASISDFFVRDLKQGTRSVVGEFVSPVDGTLRNSGVVASGTLEQVKGRYYAIAELLGDDEEARRFEGGMYFNFYLSPQDYHHVHSPMSGTIRKIIHSPGKLWPVNDWSLNTIPKLFAVNERVSIFVSSEMGEVVVVMVGATNVGKIALAFDSLVTNQAPWRRQNRFVHEYLHHPKRIEIGERLGTFHLGSSVILVCDAGMSSRLSAVHPAPCKVKFGSTLTTA